MYCPNCNKEYDGKFCPECGTKLIEKPSAGGFNLNFGDANAISGGVNLSDSHNDNSQHYDQRGMIQAGTYNAAQKSDREVDLLNINKGRQFYTEACEKFIGNDGVIDIYEERELSKIQTEYELSAEWCKQEKERVHILLRNNNSLSKSARYDLDDLVYAIKDNDIHKAITYVGRLSSLIKEKDHEELQYYYHMAIAILQPKECLSLFEKTTNHNYWHTFWSYLAYLKENNIDKARKVHNSLDSYRNYPEDNDMLIRTAGECILGDKAAERDFSRIDSGYSPILEDLYKSMTLLVRPDIAKREGLVEKDYLFYIKHIFNCETTEEREKREREEQKAREAEERRLKAEEEVKRKAEAEERRKKELEAQRKREEEERKRKAEEERLRKEAEAKRKREEEERRRAEEQKRREEEARRRAAEAEAKRKAEEEARRKAAEEVRRKEEERKRKEAETKRRREKEKSKCTEENKRKSIGFKIAIKEATNKWETAYGLKKLGWNISDPTTLKIPFVLKEFCDIQTVNDILDTLQNINCKIEVSAINELDEPCDLCYNVMATEIKNKWNAIGTLKKHGLNIASPTDIPACPFIVKSFRDYQSAYNLRKELSKNSIVCTISFLLAS